LVEVVTENFKIYKAPGNDQFQAELIQTWDETLRDGIQTHKLINSIWNKEELPQHWKESITATIYKMGDSPDY